MLSCYRSRRRRIKPISPGLLLFVFVISCGPPARAQADQEMPLFLIENSRFMRRAVDENGNLESLREMEISRISRVEDAFEVQVTLYGNEKDGQASDTVRTTIRCREQEANMVMNVLAVLLPEGRRVAVRVTSGGILYPLLPAISDTLNDVTLEVKVKQGIPGILGGRSRMRFWNRLVQPSAVADLPGESISYTITADLNVRFYALGIKLRERTFRVEEVIQAGIGMTRHLLTAMNGSYVSLERIN